MNSIPFALPGCASGCAAHTRHPCSTLLLPATLLLPVPLLQEYLSADSSPEAVLVTGWSEPGFMGQLLWELDQGQSALPPGVCEI